MSPTPTGALLNGSSGVWTCHASLRLTSSISKASLGARPACARCFTSTNLQPPFASSWRAAFRTSVGDFSSELVMMPSSSTFGHNKSAAVALSSRWCCCTPSGTTQPFAGWPITGSQM
eukprot:CAMPEP_0115841484 /NCGR_PEP_ID=MMETSP0287-20121206/7312_1 /TAXON_ID=412157 /ORGANISM="Chrysochromulina rotalis, Strain UIO044" /LENGTH=117 /DNA_ID=CAMNT_0003295131 /DNA_START=573 /DNA_END=926 /DNA_ORIENTATION=-